ncbi:MAG: Maf family protein, partial [Cyanobacteriota bacterium]|nr:Maf family protein [Cyanobacteriota bacterium]
MQAAIPHGVRVSGIDEQSIHRNNPEELVEALAAAKAGAVQLKLAADGELDTWIGVLGCDSVLVFEGEVFGKPADADEAIARWQSMAGCWAELITGHCLLSEKEPKLWRGTVRTRILFAALQKHEIIRYVSTGEPLACAGGFALEGIG